MSATRILSPVLISDLDAALNKLTIIIPDNIAKRDMVTISSGKVNPLFIKLSFSNLSNQAINGTYNCQHHGSNSYSDHYQHYRFQECSKSVYSVGNLVIEIFRDIF